MKKKIYILLVSFFLVLMSFNKSFCSDRKTSVKSMLSSATYTAATAYSSSFELSEYTEGQIYIDVTTENGTSTLDIIIQHSPDDSTWYTHTTITQITATGQYSQAITNIGKYVRIKYTVGGTSYVFSIKGTFKN